MNKIYHIYFKGSCLYHCLNEEEFEYIWDELKKLTWISDLHTEDFEYEELFINQEMILNSSH